MTVKEKEKVKEKVDEKESGKGKALNLAISQIEKNFGKGRL